MKVLLVPEKLNPDDCPELDGMPKLGLGLAGLDDHDCDPDGVVLEAVDAPSEPPPPRSSLISCFLCYSVNA